MVGRFTTGGGCAQFASGVGVPSLRMQQQVLWKLLLQNLATFTLLVSTLHSLLSLKEEVLDRAIEGEGLSRPLLSRARFRGWL